MFWWHENDFGKQLSMIWTILLPSETDVLLVRLKHTDFYQVKIVMQLRKYNVLAELDMLLE